MRSRRYLTFSGVALAAGVGLFAAGPVPPVPIDPAGLIFDAFRSHAVVGLSDGEGHGDERGRAFVDSLVRDSRFAAANIDVVTEAASSRYQAVMDRYVNGDEVSYSDLRHAWDDSTQAQVLTPPGEIPPIYRSLRDVNARLPRSRRHRALLGDPAIEWEHVQSNVDYQRWLELRDSSAAGVVEREVIAKKRRALIVYGTMHLQRRQQIANYDMSNPLAQTIVSLLIRAGVRPFVVAAIPEDDATRSWPFPRAALLAGTTLGASVEPAHTDTRVAVKDGVLVPIPRAQWISVRMEEQFDAVLYLGPASTLRYMSWSRRICSDRDYVEMHLRRMAIARLPKSETDKLTELCAR
jgi:hypothetical protein